MLDRSETRSEKTALFVTCLVDLMRPSVGFAALKLLEEAGCDVEVPPSQTCCGQPAYNNGDKRDAAAIARQVIDAFAGYRYVVAPSGSCAGMISHHYPSLFEPSDPYADKARDLARRTYELTSFLVDVLKVTPVTARLDKTVTYHDSCSGLRELKVKAQPRQLLAKVAGLTLNEMRGTEECCGFGGTFCIKYPSISANMVSKKVEHAEATDAELLLAGDMGCLLNIAGRAKRMNSALEVRHVAEVLAGDLSAPPIAGSKG